MPRKPREDFEGGLHHVWARGNGQQRIFLDAADRRIYLGMLGKVVISERWLCLAYCLMGNHVHLLVETPEANLGKGIQLLHSRYARNFNTRHRRTGHLFQGRYGSARIERESQLLATVGYIARNPVSAGLCAEADEWEWSSHAAVVGTAGGPSWLAVDRLLGLVGDNGGDPRERYRELVDR
jgi:putative transposase